MERLDAITPVAARRGPNGKPERARDAPVAPLDLDAEIARHG